MSCSGVIKIEMDEGNVYLYSHYKGLDLPGILQCSLSRKCRWNDESYLARIIFSEMIKYDINAESGYGISSWEPECDFPIIIVNCKTQSVVICENSWGFDEYIEMTLEDKINY